MGYAYAVIGAGRQGTAAAYDLVRFGDASSILLLDQDEGRARASADRVNHLTGGTCARGGRLDVRDFDAVVAALKGIDAFLSAVPYFFNPLLARAAVAARASMCDLGGNTDVVWEEHKLHEEARKAGIAIIPDCGLMPGMGNTLAAHAIGMMDACADVHIRCGGLPQNPKPPLSYKLVFSVEGLMNEYFGKAYVLREGRIAEISTFTELEAIDFPSPVGRCEAFTTTGGTSTCPWTFEGRVKNYDYKTVRYPGHYEKFKTFLDVGLLDDDPVDLNGIRVSPRKVFAKVLSKAIDFPEDRDLVVLRVVAVGLKGGKSVEVTLDVLDFHDEKTGFTAMERTTGFPAAIVTHFLAKRECDPGVIRLESGVPGDWFVAELRKRGISLTQSERVLS